MAKIVLEIQTKNKEATQSVKALNVEIKTLSETLSSIKVNKNLTTQINALTKHYKAVADAQAKITANANKQAIADEKLALAQAKVATQVAKTNTENAKRIKLETQTQKSVKITTSQTEKLVKGYADLLNTIKSLEKNYKKGTFDSVTDQVKSYFNEVKGLDSQLKSGKITQEEYNNKIVQATAQLQGFKTEVASTRTEAKNFHGTLQDTVSGFLKFQLSAMLVMKPLQLVRSAWDSINQTLTKTEDTIISFQRVVGKNISGGTISNALYKLAQDYGQTFDNVQSIALDFARTGLSWNDTIKATEAALLGLNTAELDSKDAATGLIAVLQQYKLDASDLESVIDKLNITQDNAAVTTDKLLAALQRTGSSAKNANLSLEETVALITALSSATGRSGENLGTALNSLIQYSSKDSALNVFAGLSENTADVVGRYRKGAATILEVWRAVSSEIQHLTEQQADLLDSYFETEDGSAFKDAMADDLEDMYDELAGVYTTSNTFRKNYFIALLGNMDEVDKALGNMQQSVGYSQKQNEDYLESYTAKVNSLKAKWEEVANDEQGLLGIKKDLVDLGSGVLNIVQGVGGLKTLLVIVATWVGVIVAEIKGVAIVAGLTKVLGIIGNIATLGIPNLVKQIKLAKQGIAEAGAVTKAVTTTALLAITALITAISAIDSAIRKSIEKREEAEHKAIEQQNEAITKSNESVEAQKKEVAQMNEVATSVENLRKILDDSSQSEEEKAKAQGKLLQIQNTLIESNDAYKDSLDLTNGSLKEQLGLIEKLTTEQLKQRARKDLETNSAENEIAKNRLESTSTTNTDVLFSSSGWLNSLDFRDVINSAISGAGVGDIASINEDNTYTIFDNYGKRVGEGFKNGFWDGVGELLGFGTVFDKSSYVGESNAGFSFSGTVEQQLDAIDKLKTYIATNKDSLGLTAEQVVSITTELGNKYNELNSAAYQEAKRRNEIAEAEEKFLNDIIDETEYLKIVYGIEKDISKELGDKTNDISKVTGAYDDLIKKLEELRDLNKEAYDWEEKKLAVLEAEQALENARNEATVRRFNQDTNQWEWQTDEKAIKEAEENLEKARLNLEEAAYNNIIDQLKEQTATNESILAVIKEVAPLLGKDFENAVNSAITDTTKVDLNKPIISKDGSYDSGGIANGLGFMPKATSQPETVNNPDLTAKILSPVSNAEFSRYVKDMGIMFEQAHNYARMPQFERVNNTSTDNSVNNSGQINFAGGLTVGSEQRDNMLNILSLAKIVPN